METNYRKLSSQAQAEIEALRADGVPVDDEAVIAINALCWEIENPSKRVSIARGRPIRCGNVWLWPLTIHSSSWWQDIGCYMPDTEKTLCYAMANRDKELYTTTEEDVEAWFKTLRCTQSELRIAMAEILEADKRDELPSRSDDRMTAGELAQMMVAEHGGTFEMWERQCSIRYIFEFLTTSRNQDEAERKKTNRDKRTLILARYVESLRRKKSDG